jgi:nicotinic acid phosphoribosyltransferase
MHYPFLLDTDSYKLSHAFMYPPDTNKMVAYFTCRGPLPGTTDRRLVQAGVTWLYNNVFSRRITQEDIDEVDAFCATHLAGGKLYEWPRELWQEVVDAGGYLPFHIRALEDGEVFSPGVPSLIIEAEGRYAPLVTWFETQILRMWSDITTATKSAQIRHFLASEYDRTVDDKDRWLLDYALHDFGSRGTSSAETAMRTGAAHLLVFDGTDNLIAASYARSLANGAPIGQSVYATEHSVMTSWDCEENAIQNLLDRSKPGDILSIVADSYDYRNFINNIVPKFVEQFKAKQTKLVVRPDSGDPVQCVIEGLVALEKVFGYTVNSKGFKVIDGAGVIQGDGIGFDTLQLIATEVTKAEFAAQNVVYGMGGGLLQKQTRDTLKCAIKLCERTDITGRVWPIMKAPVTDRSKWSLPGNMAVYSVGGIRTVFPKPMPLVWRDNIIYTDKLKSVWNNGPTDWRPADFATQRQFFFQNWMITTIPYSGNRSAMSEEILEKQRLHAQ